MLAGLDRATSNGVKKLRLESLLNFIMLNACGSAMRK